jgi:hypothetical protein
MKIQSNRTLFAALVLFQLVAAQRSAFGALSTWAGGGVSGAWSLTANWSGGALPAATNDVLFSGVGAQKAMDDNILTNIHSITFSASGYTLSDFGLFVTNGIIATNTTGGNTFFNVISLGANQSFTNLNAGAQLSFQILNLAGRGLTFRGAGTNLMFSVITDTVGGGSLTNAGTGIFQISASNPSFTGPTVLNSGTNIISSVYQLSPIIWTGGTLMGAGKLGQVTASGGAAKILRPGTSPGILTTSNLVLNSSVTNVMEINGLTAGIDYDQIVVSNGNVTLGSATLSLSFLGSLAPSFGDTITLINVVNPTNTVSGTFASLPEGSTFTNNSYIYELSYAGGDGNDVTLTVSGYVSTGGGSTWDGGGVNNLWTNGTNWSGNVAPVQGDALTFPASAVLRTTNVNDFPAETTFDSLFFVAPSLVVLKDNISGNAIRLNNGVRVAPTAVGATDASGTVVVSNHIGLNFSQTFTNAVDTDVHFAGGVDLAGNTLTLGVRGNTDMHFEGSVTGDGVFSVHGPAGSPGRIHLLASNAIAGGIVVNSGLLIAQHAQALGSATAGPVHVSTNGTLLLQASNATFTGSSIVVTGVLAMTPAPNSALAAPLVIAGSNAVVRFTNAFTGGSNFTFQGPVTNTTQFTNLATALRIGPSCVIQGGGLIRVLGTMDVDGVVHNVMALGSSIINGNLSGSGQIDTVLCTNTGATITPGSATDPTLASAPLRVGNLLLGATTTLQISLFPTLFAGGTTNDVNVATNVVISQIYGAGGNTAATLKNDFVELFNPTPNTIDLSTWSVQYAPVTSSSWQIANLRGSIPAYHYYLLQLFSNGAIGSDLPIADATNTINMNAVAAKVALVNNQTSLTGTNPVGSPGIIDFVGYGTNASGFEGSAPAPNLTNNQSSLVRNNGGFADSNDNANDFSTISPPTPRNTASPANAPSGLAVITSNAPTLGNAALKLTARTNFTPGQQFTIIRNDNAAPVTNTFKNLPEGSVLAATNGNLALQISYAAGDSNDVVLTVLSNTPPTFAASTTNLTVNELSTLNYSNVISDLEQPPQTYTWTLLTPISGLALNPTNGLMTWTPTEAQGPSSNNVLVKVTDSGTPPLSSTGTVNITVKEVNQAPVPVPVPDTNILAGNTVTIQLVANDSDIPANPLTWFATGLPTGASVSSSGLFTYTPPTSESGAKAISIKVFDVNTNAASNQSLTNTVSFTVNVLVLRIVINTNDSGPGSLRQAMIEVNTNAGGGEIHFAIPGTGPFKIAPASNLPALSRATVIDGYTQTNSHPNTNVVGDNAVIMIEISGETGISGPAIAWGGFASGQPATIRGLCINRFTNGTALVSGCTGCSFSTASGSVVEGCFIGTDITGTFALPNGRGIQYLQTINARIGGPDPSQRNIISGNQFYGIEPVENEVINHHLTIQNNYIGTDHTGTNALGNLQGGINAPTGGVGGPGFHAHDCLIADNVVCANGASVAGPGINWGGPTNRFLRNKIGIGADGSTSLGNAGAGLDLFTSDSTIGSTNLADANLIANNGSRGLTLSDGSRNASLGNSFFNNGGLAIDLGNTGRTGNDSGDGDTGPNDLQNFPILTSIVPVVGTIIISGTLNSISNTTYRIEFFHSPDFAPNNLPQAKTFLTVTNATTDAGGNASFSVTTTQTISGGFITATATDPAGNTSEISDGLPFARLDITTVGSQVRLLWLTNLTGFILQSNVSVLQPASWSNVPGSPGATNTSFFRDFSPSDAPRYFRLRLP